MFYNDLVTVMKPPRIYSAVQCSSDVVYDLALASEFPTEVQIADAIKNKFAAKESDGWRARPLSRKAFARLVWSTAKNLRERRNGT